MIGTPEDHSKLDCCVDKDKKCNGPECVGWQWVSSSGKHCDGYCGRLTSLTKQS